MGNKRGDITWETLAPWIIGIGVLAIILIFAVLLKGQLSTIADKIAHIFK